ncbi:hypothetical protein HK102_012057 [Quaeritorhiza haematococci]|nr:hypothetical protein HK102_012057 [Quaeritorhiza haematococci]
MRTLFTLTALLSFLAAMHSASMGVQGAPTQSALQTESETQSDVNMQQSPESDQFPDADEGYNPDTLADSEEYPSELQDYPYAFEYPEEYIDAADVDESDEIADVAGPGFRGGYGYGGYGIKGYPGFRTFIYAPQVKKVLARVRGPQRGSFGGYLNI